MTMLPGLPPREKSFKGWLFPLMLPIAGSGFVGGLAATLACVFGDQAVRINDTRYAGWDAVARIVLATPVFVVGFLWLVTTSCWRDSRLKSLRQR